MLGFKPAGLYKCIAQFPLNKYHTIMLLTFSYRNVFHRMWDFVVFQEY